MNVPEYLYFHCFLHDALLATIHSCFMSEVRVLKVDHTQCLAEVMQSQTNKADEKLLLLRVAAEKFVNAGGALLAMPNHSDRYVSFDEIPAKFVSLFQHIDHDDVNHADAWKTVLRK